MNVLVVASHPDDEVLGAGATIAKLAAEGHSVHIAILAQGITSRYANPADAPERELQQLRERAKAVGALLGAKGVYLHDFPDNAMDAVPLLHVVKDIEHLVNTLRPEVVYVQHGGDLNIDHVVTYRATLTATRPMADSPVREVYAYEVGSSTEWAFQQFAPHFHPNTFVDISATLERKIAAMQLYDSEARKFPHPRSPEALRAQAQFRGAQAGLLAAEAFQLVRKVER